MTPVGQIQKDLLREVAKELLTEFGPNARAFHDYLMDKANSIKVIPQKKPWPFSVGRKPNSMQG